MPYSVVEAHTLFEQLPGFAAARLREISGMALPYIEITGRYAKLLARLTYLLGQRNNSTTAFLTSSSEKAFSFTNGI